jgi:hypothetical protein
MITYSKKRVSKLTSTLKGSKLSYSSYVERFKVNFKVQRFKVTHAALWKESFKVTHTGL